ncbi:MAG: RNA pyrophosphohydrolase [Hyphomicrobium sp.]
MSGLLEASLTTNGQALPYRHCVGQMVINRNGHVWVGRRSDSKTDAEGRGDWWQMPQGGVDEGEDVRTAALRELREETGIHSVEIIAEHSAWLTYDLPSALIGKAWGGRYRGQSQKWFALRFLGPDSEVSIDPPPGCEREFDAWRWTAVDELLELIVPFKREVYRAVLAEFATLAVPLAK